MAKFAENPVPHDLAKYREMVIECVPVFLDHVTKTLDE